MENNSIKFDKDTPAIVAADKVQSLMAVNKDTGEVGNVEFPLLAQEAGKHVADAVKVTGNVLPTLGDANKRYSFTTGNAGRTLTYGATSLVYGANKQCSAFWDGVAKIWSKEDEVELPNRVELNIEGGAVGFDLFKNKILTLYQPELAFKNLAFNNVLELASVMQSTHEIIDVELYRGWEATIKTNSFNQIYSGWKDVAGGVILVFQMGGSSSVGTRVETVPANAKYLCLSKYGSTSPSVVFENRKFANLSAEIDAKNAIKASEENKGALDVFSFLNKVIPLAPLWKTKTYFNASLIETAFSNDQTQSTIIDVSNYAGKQIVVYVRSTGSTFSGFKNEANEVISTFQTLNIYQPNYILIPTGAKWLYLSNYALVSTGYPYVYIQQGDSTTKDLTNYYDYIKNADDFKLNKFFEKLALKTKNPINLLFGGDSIVNWQRPTNMADFVYADEAKTKPPFMYNRNHFVFKAWQLLNPNTLNTQGVIQNESGNLTYIKADDNRITKSGNWISNFTGSGYNGLGGYASHSTNAIQEVLHSKTQGDYLEFVLPVGAAGFSVVVQKFTGNKTFDSFTSGASTGYIYVNNVLLKSFTANENNKHAYIEHTFASALTVATTIKIENAEAKWLPIWGVEYWTDICVRPINSGVSSATINSWYANSFTPIITNNTPDLIIHECNIINDRGGNLAATLNSYKTYIEYCQENNISLLFLITHDTAGRNLAHTTLAIDLIRLFKAYKVPYINVWKWLDDLSDGLNINGINYLDGTHLSTLGHEEYSKIIRAALKFGC